MAAVAALSLSACGRNGSLELPPGPASIQPAPVALSAPPPGPIASDASALPPPVATAGVQPAPAALSTPPPGPVASDASTALPTAQETIAKTGFDAHGNPAATPGQKKPFFLDWLLQ
jgi:Prokaryotic lipoprotein-attachment site